MFINYCNLTLSHAGIAFYDVINSVPFDSSVLTNSSIKCVPMNGRLECDPGGKLDDGVTGSGVDSIFDNLDLFFAFSRQSGKTGIMEYTLNASTSSPTIDLYFFNQPSNSIGLPTISVSTVVNRPVPYLFSENSDLSRTDSTVKNVLLHLLPQDPINFITVKLEFTNDSEIDWTFVSEGNLLFNSKSE